MPVEYFFPTPIYFSFIENKEIDFEIQSCLDQLDEKDLFNPWGDTVKTTFKYGKHEHALLKIPNLHKEIDRHIKEFLATCDITSNFSIEESWFNISNYLGFQHFHIHDGYDISGVYYYKTSKNDGDIVFNNPSLVNRYHRLTSKTNTSIRYTPEKGKLILFPSFLEHAVFHNQTQQDRISISFNVSLRKF